MKIARRRRFVMALPLASMGDIAFLLIIFFMLTSNFIKESQVQLELPRSPDIATMEREPISVAVDERGDVWLQGELLGSADLLESAVRALIEGQSARVVMLSVDKNLPRAKFGPVFMALSRANAEIALVGEKTE